MPRGKNSLEATLAKLQGEYGTNSVMRASEIPQYDVFSTGSMALDYAIGVGGLPTNRVVEIAGEEGVGKTTLVLHAVNNALKKFPEKFALYIDAEHRLTPDWVANFVEDQDRVIVVKPDHVEQATDMYVEAVTTGQCAIAVFDSIGGTPSMRVTEKSAEKGNIGGNALSVTRFAQFAQINSGKYNTCTIGINQKRDDMEGYNRLVTPGGRAWKHAASLRIEFKRGKGKAVEKIDDEPVQVGKSIVAKVHKNSLAAPGKATSFWFYNIPTEKYGFGIDHVEEITRIALLSNVIERLNSVMYAHHLFPDGKIKGRDAVFDFVSANPDAAEEISREVMEALSSGHVDGVVSGFDPDDDKSEDPDVGTDRLEISASE